MGIIRDFAGMRKEKVGVGGIKFVGRKQYTSGRY
jgi:hypothetical protein